MRGALIAIDHIAMTSSDMKQTIFFYCDVLGLELQTFIPSDGVGRRMSLKIGDQKINIHEEGSPYTPHAKKPISGTVDMCFLSSLPLEQWQIILCEKNILVEAGPARKTGASGPIMSIYVRDPDENLIEISNKI